MESRRNRVRVYIAGPMTNGSGNSFNMRKIHEAVQVHLTLIKAGYVPHCPQLTVFAEFLQPECISYNQWLELDRCYIDDCDVVLRLDGASVGADRECTYAKNIGTPVVYGISRFLSEYRSVIV